MQYALLFYTPPDTLIPASERETRIAKTVEEMVAWQLQRAGVFRASLRLAAANTATSLRGRAGEVLATDGPFAETKEVLGGLVIVDCTSFEEALAWARGCPIVQIGAVEVRAEFGARR